MISATRSNDLVDNPGRQYFDPLLVGECPLWAPGIETFRLVLRHAGLVLRHQRPTTDDFECFRGPEAARQPHCSRHCRPIAILCRVSTVLGVAPWGWYPPGTPPSSTNFEARY